MPASRSGRLSPSAPENPFQSLRVWLQAFFGDGDRLPPPTPAQEAAFQAYSRDRSHRAAVILCVLVIIADLIA